jgi:hypothetical protein
MGAVDYHDWLDLEAAIEVRFVTRRSEVTHYAVLLLAYEHDDVCAVRLYDNAHGNHDMHRYNREGIKQAAETFHQGSAGEAMRSAIEAVRSGYQGLIESWRR